MHRNHSNPDANALVDQQPDLILIPEYNIQLAAGGGAYPGDHALAIKSRAFSRKWLANKGLQANKLALVRVMGDSMEPSIRDKDLVLIDRTRKHPSDAMPFAVRVVDALYIKMVRQWQDKLRLISLNKAYDPIEVHMPNDAPDCEIIGAVVWHAHSWV